MVLATTVGAWAGHVGEQQARQRAAAFMTGHAATRGVMTLTRVYLPLQTKSAAWSVTDAPIYIYNRDGGGYVIVSGDDRTADILGFSEKGQIDPDRLPVNMKHWLQGYATKIERIPTSAVPYRKASTRGGGAKTNLPTKMKTEWGQDYPFNLHTPELALKWKERDTVVHAATGCVATAMSMVMNYYRYPAKLKKDLPSYNGKCDVPVVDGETGEQDTVKNVKWKTEAIAANTSIDWANITDKYNKKSKDTEIEAVSRLMQYCGSAVNMQYGIESQSDNSEMLTGIKEVFGYDDVYCLNDFEYDDQGWIDVVYREMSLAGPVMFGGITATMGGHEFILDGYQYKDGKDYFWVNWGWDGEDNGYMLLSVMDPGWIINDEDEHEGFTEYQDMVCGMGPDGKGYTTVPNLTLYLEDISFGVDGKQYSRSSKSASFKVSDYYIYFWNIHLPELTVVPVLGVFNKDNKLVNYTNLADKKGKSFKWGIGSIYESADMSDAFPIGSGLDDGTYTVKAITKMPDTDDWTPMQNMENFTITMTVSGNKCSFSTGGTTAIRKVVADTPAKTDDAWYSLSGTRLNSKPTTQGIYIHQGRKVMITP
jgi:hypothetical protein